ncbi:MAG: serine hydrolase domain-containing protein [Ruminococcus sp.]
MKKILAIILSLILTLSLASCSSENEEKDRGDTKETKVATITDEVKKNMDSILEKKSFEGIVCLTENGSVVYQSVTGKDEKGSDLTIDSAMYIGSISKQFCSSAILFLRDQGKLSVDDTLDKYFSEYKYGKDITLKNLLSMRSGISDMAGNVKGISADKTEDENTEIIKKWIFSQPLEFEPDSSIMYCNSNYFLLANIVEQVSEQSYEDFIRENFFEPLGMTHSGFIKDVKDEPEWAKGLTYDTFTLGEDSQGLTKGAGDIVSNASDMDKWMTGLSTGKLISLDSYREMTTNYSTETTKGYGYGMFVSFFGGVGHSGLIGNYTSFDYINEEKGYNLFVSSNNNYMGIESLPSELLGDLIQQ